MKALKISKEATIIVTKENRPRCFEAGIETRDEWEDSNLQSPGPGSQNR